MTSTPPDVYDEPHYRSSGMPAEPDEHEVWSEPGLFPHARPSDPERTHSAWLRKQWQATRPGSSWLFTFALALVAGPLAILSTFLKAGSFFHATAVIVMAPLVEEIAKVLVPLMVLERWPYRFTSARQPLLICVLSGLAFAQMENWLYFNVYLTELSSLTLLWRRTICVGLHVGCSTIAGLGLRRMWLTARTTQARADIRLAAPYLLTAMVIHGAYNVVALMLQVTKALIF